jgi:O-antigen ligase
MALIAPAFAVAAVLLGGASAAGWLANLILYLMAIGVLIYAIWSKPGPALAPAERWLLAIGGAFLLCGLLQLVPLPAALWRMLPGRAPIAGAFELLHVQLPALPLSLDPEGTRAGLLPLILALAAIVSVRQIEDRQLTILAWTIPLLGAVSILLGMAQIGGGQDSPLYLYTITNRGQPVGFFSNSNHLATLIVLGIPFIAAIARRRLKGHVRERLPQAFVLGALTLFLVLAGVVVGSVAGIALLVPSLIGSVLIFLGRGTSRLSFYLMLAALAALVLFVGLASHSQMLNGFGMASVGTGSTGRTTIYETTWKAILDFFPAGSGLGSFSDIYRWYEDPTKVTSVYVNHAHNDYLELVLETGIVGVLLIIAMLAWWARRTAAVWLGRDESPFAKAASVASAIVLAHSLVDYPMRTGAIVTCFAMCLAIMARPAEAPAAASQTRQKARHLSVV